MKNNSQFLLGFVGMNVRCGSD